MTEPTVIVIESDPEIIIEIFTEPEIIVEISQLQGPQGPTGETGAQGEPGIILTYIHTQLIPLDTWTINHNLDKYPSVTIVDSAETVVRGSVVYTDTNTLVLSFSVGFSGKAYLN